MRWFYRLIAAAALTATLAVSACSPAVNEPTNSRQQSVDASVHVPELIGRVNDYANLLSPAQEATLSSKLEAIETNTPDHDQVVILTVADMGGNDDLTYGLSVARTWRLGQAGKNNGMLILVAVAERRIRFVNGGGIQGTMTDAQGFLIRRRLMIPHLESGHEDYFGALNAGVDGVSAILRGQSTGDTAVDTGRDPSVRVAHSGGAQLHLPPGVALVLIIGGIATLLLGFANGFISPVTGAATGAGAAFIGGATAFGSLALFGFGGLVAGAILGLIAQGLRSGAITPGDILIFTGGGGGGGGGSSDSFGGGGGGDFDGGGGGDSF